MNANHFFLQIFLHFSHLLLCTLNSLLKRSSCIIIICRPQLMELTAAARRRFLLVLLLITAAALAPQRALVVSGSSNETDRLSLLDFKHAISLDPRHALRSWNDSTSFCDWEGVVCGTMRRRVISLDLPNRGLVGVISPSLGNLTLLRRLSLPTNSLAGEIPWQLGQLRQLRDLYLSNNTLRGRIPISLTNCSFLTALWLDRNQLSGHIPADLHRGLLHELHLSVNSLTGTIPASLANITTLAELNFALNGVEGNVPMELGKLPDLRILNAGGNRLTGRFEQAILNISTLVFLNLGQNRFTGEVPSNVGNSLRNIQQFALANNLFHGEIPSSLTNASALRVIEVSGNNFTGLVPGSIGKLSNLTWLNLEFNQLQASSKQDWEFMDSLANCTKLHTFSVERNQLGGNLPGSLANLSSELQSLYLGRNQLQGCFPPGIANLPNLIVLGMNQNLFTGAIPQWLGTLNNLQILGLAGNSFTGFIPSSLSNLSLLTDLLLDSNHFSGQIPPSFGNIKGLGILNISNNSLHGRAPEEIFRIPTITQIDLSFNGLDGELPTGIGSAKQLVSLQLSSNRLSGVIPSTLGDCESLQDISLDWNSFSGSIPASLGKISSLVVLNVSHNNLTGSIPASLGSLQLLEQLDLSFNHLRGEVPKEGIFGNTTAVHLDENKELCGGALELHLLACFGMPNLSRDKESIVLKIVVALVSIVVFAMVVFVFLLWRRVHKRKSTSLAPFSGEPSLPSFGRSFRKVSFSDLARATEGFSDSNLIGRGRHGSVYQGKLVEDGNYVAVKVFSLETVGAQESFIAECNAMRNVRHRNLVPILTACSSIDSSGNDFRALIYEFMPRGDLHKLIYLDQDYERSSDFSILTLAQRIDIMVDVGDALEYLHHNNQGTIVHCDLKPSNILLDDNMTAHVGDFGLARFIVDSKSQSSHDSCPTSLFSIRGTIGYVAPEYARGSQVSTAADVYSFGIILLEIFIRRRPTDEMFKDGVGIVEFTEMNFPERISEIADPQLLQELDLHQEVLVTWNENGALSCLISMFSIGLSCTKSSPSERITMQEVAARLHEIRGAYL